MGLGAAVHGSDDEAEHSVVMLASVGLDEFESAEKGLSRQETAAASASWLDGPEAAGRSSEPSETHGVVGRTPAEGPYVVEATVDGDKTQGRLVVYVERATHMGTAVAGMTPA